MIRTRRSSERPIPERIAAPVGSAADSRDPFWHDIATAPGIGPKRAALLHKRGIATVGHTLQHLPNRYVDLRTRHRVAELAPGMDAIVEGQLENLRERPMRASRFRRIVTAFLRDSQGARVRVVWFNLASSASFPIDEPVLLDGAVGAGTDGRPEIVHPEIYRLRQGTPPPIRAVYRLPPEVPQRLFGRIVESALERMGRDRLTVLPPELRAQTELPTVEDALAALHRPPADALIDRLEAGETPAHQALAFDEMFTFQLALARERARLERRTGAAFIGASRLTTEFLAELPFRPTAAQTRVIDEIAPDLARATPMNRILIGDVGSGKTLVAFWAALRAAENSFQTAMMAPTELLAEQHFRGFQRLCGHLGVMSALLTGKVTGSERARLIRALQRGDIQVIFGTQALIQEHVRLHRLGLAIIDEQHRFGVFDRARLTALGSEANVLLMTATPIPRSLALTLFRNLAVSTLDEMPPGRAPITTEVIHDGAIAAADMAVQAAIAKGQRAYYVLPMIDGDEPETDSVAAMTRRLTEGPLAAARVAPLHGRMRPAEKDAVMRAFRDGALDVLVSTTVVEVGIDVPEATVMVLVAAERYGLAQLHQLRGRVGRGREASRCCLVLSRGAEPDAIARLELLANCSNGLEVAEADLRLRGPGDLLGARQTGALPLKFAGLIRDFRLIEQAGNLAEEWLRRDPGLACTASARAQAAITRMLNSGFSLGDIG